MRRGVNDCGRLVTIFSLLELHRGPSFSVLCEVFTVGCEMSLQTANPVPDQTTEVSSSVVLSRLPTGFNIDSGDSTAWPSDKPPSGLGISFLVGTSAEHVGSSASHLSISASCCYLICED